MTDHADSASPSSPTTAGAAPSVAIVTGGSRGIGRATVEALLGAGWRVFFCSRNQTSVDAALANLTPRHAGAVTGRAFDVRHQPAVDAFVTEVAAAAGRIDCLVNNAGLGTFGAVDTLSAERFAEVVETNLYAPFYFIRAVAPTMKRQGGGGWIFNIGSLAGRNAMAGGAAYNASKFGLVGLSEAAMLDLRPAGVRVAAILPGSVDTSFGDPGRRPADRSWMLAPEDVAAMVLHLLSYPERALPSLVEMRPTHPPGR